MSTIPAQLSDTRNKLLQLSPFLFVFIGEANCDQSRSNIYYSFARRREERRLVGHLNFQTLQGSQVISILTFKAQ